MFKLLRVLSIVSLLITVFMMSGSALAQTCTDLDGDGYGLNGDGSCPNTGVDCNDNNPTIYPGAPLKCDGLDNNCDGNKDFMTDEDKDGDGEPWCAGDCDDNNPNRAHIILEGPYGDAKCSDFIDNDCDNRVDSADSQCKNICTDKDGDGYGNPGHISCTNGSATDCNDNNAAINPGASDDNCDGIDDNCSGTPDDGYVVTPTNCGVGECASSGQLECQNGIEVDTCAPGPPVDECALPGDPANNDGIDNDCDGIIDNCPIGPCWDVDGDGYGVNGDASCPNGTQADCNDINPAIHPGLPDDICDGVDDNCSGIADDDYVVTPTSCGVGECFSTGQLECQSGAEVNTCVPGVPVQEICDDGLDNDCDGLIDQVGGIEDPDCNNSKLDNDGDGYCSDPVSCTDGSTPGDCDDTNITIYPNAPLKCDALDNNCDGNQDFMTDEDKDGDGEPWCAGDCDDNNSNRAHTIFEGPPGDAKCSDGIDNDCDNRIDMQDSGGCEGYCVDDDGDGYGQYGGDCANGSEVDCNDNDSNINPGASDDNCDVIDDNCSGTPDDGYVVTPTNCGIGECANSGQLECQSGVEVDTCVPGAPVAESPIGSPECGDGLDNDCDGTIDILDSGCAACSDDDGDGYGCPGDPACSGGILPDCECGNPLINPGVGDDNCDGVDDNCSGIPDDDYIVTPTNCGIGECFSTGQMECQSGTEVNTCTPGTPVPEICDDGLDNDCDGLIDQIGGIEDPDCDNSFIDNDGDGFCADSSSCTDGSTPGDCDDTNITVYPNAPLKCDALDNNCDGNKDFMTDEDKDNDGVPWCAGDCDDNNPLRYPGYVVLFGGPECSDGIDNNCNNRVDDLTECPLSPCTDNDGDGYGNPGHPTCPNGSATDCNDNDPAINPGGDDANCNGIDEDCSGIPDDGFVPIPIPGCGVGVCATPGWRNCEIGALVDVCIPGTPGTEGPLGDPTCTDGLDNDCDGLTDIDDSNCLSACLDSDGDGYGSNGHPSCPNGPGIDCNDNDPTIPRPELPNDCNGIDEDCSGTADDGYVGTPTSCGIGVCASSGQMECLGGIEVDTCVPGTPDPPICMDGLDNDCDGLVDQSDMDECPPATGIDNDGDGFCADPVSCTDGSNPKDCDDTNNTIYPGAPLKCDGLDNNCDGSKDFMTDEDKDGDGEPWCAGDCDDTNPLRSHYNLEFSGTPECGDGIDNDCDNTIDMNDDSCYNPCSDKDGDGYGNPGHPSCVYPATDCDDINPAIYPGLPDDDCNGVDDNCSGVADDGYVVTPTNCGIGVCTANGQLECVNGAEVDTCVALTPPQPNEVIGSTCNDTLDNDCDSLTDSADGDCFDDCLDNDSDGYGSNGHINCTAGTAIDCNDNDAAINPGASDANCNSIDNNCSGTADDGYVVTPTNCGVGECASTGQLECQGGTEVDTCVPLVPGIEGPLDIDPTCHDGLDNDCDGDIDSFDINCSTCDDDMDGDGFCPGSVCGCGGGGIPGDCDDLDNTVFPGAPIACDAKDTNCDGSKDFMTDEDKDGDGVPWCASDCDDNDPARYPGNTEGPYGDPTCSDGIDNDCDNIADPPEICSNPCSDNDGDGYGYPGDSFCANGNATDCNDYDATVNPGGDDTNCNGIDEDCSGIPDDGYVATPTNCGIGECARSGQLACQSGVIVDTCIPGTPIAEIPFGGPLCNDGLDNDCDGTNDASDIGCLPCTDNDGDGYGSNGDITCINGTAIDCNDNDPTINPGGDDANCNGVDENCDGTADDGFIPPPTFCGEGACYVADICQCLNGIVECDCTPLPPVPEICDDGIDNDCDGLTDQISGVEDPDCDNSTIDNDGDGFCADPVSCTDGSNPGDCDDTHNTVYPGAPLLCDALDNNCDGTKDFLTDEDKDGDGEAWCAGDCDDNNPNRSHNIIESAFCGYPTSCSDGIDNDCDNRIDIIDASCSDSCPDCDGDGYGAGHPACPNSPFLDCDDSNPNVNPGVTEGPIGDATCSDTLDNDCDALTDSSDPNCQSLTCIDNLNCLPGNYCEKPSGVCDGQGTCQPLPEVCTTVVDPVCGCDFITYSNSCEAAMAGINVEYTGVCGSQNCIDLDLDGYGSNGDPSCVNGPAVDCNDNDAAINPGATDAYCDGVDSNCNGTPDEGYVVTPTNCGVGECASSGQLECQGGIEVDTCVPLAQGVEGPTGDPTCADGLDNDCDGTSDVADADCTEICPDVDGDGFPECNGTCDPMGVPCDCIDNDSTIYPGAPPICDGLDTDCDGNLDFPTDVDQDGDGVPLCAGDCDDINPIACCDSDLDGYGNAGGYFCTNGPVIDCNDSNAAINPGATDNDCNNVDNNCSGTPDDGYVATPTNCGVGECTASGQLECQSGAEVDTCVPLPPVTEGPAGDLTCADGLDNDCDGQTDTDDYCSSGNILENGSFENGTTGWTVTAFQNISTSPPHVPTDGSSMMSVTDVYGELIQSFIAADTTMDLVFDRNLQNPVFSPVPLYAMLVEGRVTNSSGGLVDSIGFTGPPAADTWELLIWHITNLTIGEVYNLKIYVEPSVAICAPEPCTNETGTGTVLIDNITLHWDHDGDGQTENLGDCDDTDATVYTGAPDYVCDGLDNDCDGIIKLIEQDNDNDGYVQCTIDTGGWDGPIPKLGGDCDDNDPAINPGATDTNCDYVDNNCSGTLNDGYVVTPTNCGTGECVSTGQLECQSGVEVDSCVPLPPVTEGPIGDPTCVDSLDNDCNGQTDGSDAGCIVPSASTIYATSYDGTQIIAWDISNGTITVVGPTGTIDTLTTAFSPDGILYTVTNARSDGSNSYLSTINMSTGTATAVGGPLNIGYMTSLEFAPDGTIYGGAFTGPGDTPPNDSYLYSIDTLTGTPSLIGALGFDAVMDFAFDSSGTLWAVNGGPVASSDLYTIDLATGAGTYVSTITNTTSSGFIMAIMFDASDTLYATEYLNSTTPLYTVDTLTGVATLVGVSSKNMTHGGDIYLAPVQTDSDGDGVMDDIDNCINDRNPDQIDCDGDGVGVICNGAELPLCTNTLVGLFTIEAGSYYDDIYTNVTYDILGGTDGGIITGQYQPDPLPTSPTGDMTGSSRIIDHNGFMVYGVPAYISTNQVSPIYGSPGQLAPVILDNGSGIIIGDFSSLDLLSDGTHHVIGTPIEAFNWHLYPPTGTYNVSTGEYTLTWGTPGDVVEPFNFYGTYHLTGHFIPGCTNADGDSYTSCGGDCDDTDSNVNPSVTEGPVGDPTCSDTLDNDCDGNTDSSDLNCQ